ncbi:MAG: OTU domain-containing protein, partial [Chitinophagaceae bacterium]
ISTSQVWATELEVRALASVLDSPVVLLEIGKPPKPYNENGRNNPIFLQHVNGNHFISCVPSGGKTSRYVYSVIKSRLDKNE